MRILKLEAANFARLKAISIAPTGNVVKITGANKQGKTSVLAAIETALRGRQGAPAEPIRRGAPQADLFVDLGEFTISRTITRDQDTGDTKWSMAVHRKDGSKITKTPQALIDAFYTALTVDPLAFVRADTKTQVDMLKRLVKDFDFEANQDARDAAYAERTMVNRSAKEQRILAQKILVPPGDKPQAMNIAEIGKRFEEATKHNAKIGQDNLDRQHKRFRAGEMLDRAKELRRQADMEEQEAIKLLGLVEDSENNALKPIDITEVQAEFARAEEIKRVIAQFDAHEARLDDVFKSETASAELSEEIRRLDAEARAAIARAKLPQGLSFDENGVWFNDLPFAQASSAESMEVACAVAMALSPDLKVILVDGAERLDSKEMAILEGIAEREGYDLWLTIVDESGASGFVIYDGAVLP